MSDPCICTEDGWCPRYERRMVGRLRAICRGEGVTEDVRQRYLAAWQAQKGSRAADAPIQCPFAGEEIREGGKAQTRTCGDCPGTPALKLFRCNHPAREPEDVTVADCQVCPWRPRPTKPEAKHLILRNYCPPGDVLVMTAALHGLHQANPGQFVTAVDSSAPALWEHNPDASDLTAAREKQAEVLEMHYPLVNQSNDLAVHAMQGYCSYLEEQLKVKVPLLVNRPLLYLSRKEKSWMGQIHEILGRPAKYWVVCAGRKDDFTAKFWGTRNFQEVVNRTAGRILWVQVGAENHHHPRLQGAIDLVGKTDLRQLVRLCWHAAGGLGGVTLLQHLMAALEKPYISVMGGREPVQWNAYPLQTQMHALGMLDCCRTKACWKSKVYPVGSKETDSACEQPLPGDEPLPRCMGLIDPSDVARAVTRFLS